MDFHELQNRVKSRPVYLLSLAAVAAIYFGMAGLASWLFNFGAPFDLIWMPAGIAVAATYILGYRIWPAIAAAAFAFTALNLFLEGYTPAALTAASAVVALGKTVEAAAATLIIRRFAGDFNPLRHIKDYLRFVVWAALAATLAGSAVAVLGYALTGGASVNELGELFILNWSGSAASVLIFTPLILAFANETSISRRPLRVITALLIVAISVISLDYILHRSAPGQATPPVVGLLIPVFIASIIWAAIRLGPRGITTALFMTWLIVLWDTAAGEGSLVMDTGNQSFLMVQASWLALTIVTMIPAAAIAESHEFARKLNAQNDTFEALLNAQSELGEGVLVVDIYSQKIVFANAAYQKLSGYSEEELVALPNYFGLVAPRSISQIKERVSRTLDGEPVAPLQEFAMQSKSGNIVEIEVATKDLEIDGKRRGMIIVRDITERKHMESQLMQTMHDLERSNADLQQFAYVASHDLQEPLRTVSSFIGLLEQGYGDQLDENAREYIDFAVDGTRRMQNMIDDLLVLSRVGSRGEPLRPCDMETVLDAALTNLHQSLSETDASVTRDPLPEIYADCPQMTQLLQNLISNAIRFRSQEPPSIHVSARQDDSFWEFSVKDNGIGIDPKFHSRIFEIFQRLHSRSKYPGTGIGLALCKKIVTRHGGDIRVESEPGKGSTFYFKIPQPGGDQ